MERETQTPLRGEASGHGLDSPPSSKRKTKPKMCFQVEFIICVPKGPDTPRNNNPLLRWDERAGCLGSGNLGEVGSCTERGSDSQEQMSLQGHTRETLGKQRLL